MNGPPSESDQSQMLQDYLSKNNEPCPSCEYDLHGLKGNKCPECGQELLLRVGLATPNLAAFIVGLIGLASAAGFSGTMSVLFFCMFLIYGRGSSEDDSLFLVLVVELISSIVLLIIWSRANSWIRRRSKRMRWYLALACWILPLLGVALFLYAGQ